MPPIDNSSHLVDARADAIADWNVNQPEVGACTPERPCHAATCSRAATGHAPWSRSQTCNTHPQAAQNLPISSAGIARARARGLSDEPPASTSAATDCVISCCGTGMRSPLENAPFCALHHRAGDFNRRLVNLRFGHEGTQCVGPRRQFRLRTWVLHSEPAPPPQLSAFNQAGRERLPLIERFVRGRSCAASSAAHTDS